MTDKTAIFQQADDYLAAEHPMITLPLIFKGIRIIIALLLQNQRGAE